MLGFPVVYRRPEGQDEAPRYLAGQVIGGNAEDGWTLLLHEPQEADRDVMGARHGGGRGEFHIAGALQIDLREAENEAAARAKAEADAQAAAEAELEAQRVADEIKRDEPQEETP